GSGSLVHLLDRFDLNKLGWMARLVAFKPGIARQAFGLAQAFAQALLDCQWRVNRFTADSCDADALGKVLSAFEEVGILAVVLKEKRGSLQCFFRRFDGDQQIGFANFLAGCPAHNDLPGALLADEPNVFYRGFGTVARTADGPHFHLGGSEE